MTTSYKKVLAIDSGMQGTQFAVLEHGQVIKPVKVSRIKMTKFGLQRLQKLFKPDLMMLTGPETSFFPEHIDGFPIRKEKRLQALLDGVHFLTPSAPALIIIFEVGCHIFYRTNETVYVGCLPYSYGSANLKRDLAIEAEMGHEVGKPLDVCVTYALPGFPHSENEKELLHYTIALGLKEFFARYQVASCYVGGNITNEVIDNLEQFLPSVSMKMLENSSHVAAFGLLLPYIASDL